MKRSSSLGNQIKEHATKKTVVETPHLIPTELIPMGSTLVNLAMSGTTHGGAKVGTMVNVIGASHGAKSLLALTTFAETNMLSHFDAYKFYYDDVERANSFDMNYLFGSETAKRVVAPRMDKDEMFSETVQHFHANMLYLLKKQKPFIYVLDSFDALDSLEDIKKTEEMAKAIEAKKDTAGTYGMAKAKASSSILRSIVGKLADSKSALFIVSQTRDNVDPMSFSKETRSGGRALKFYASHEMWLKPTKAIKKKDTIIGGTINLKITKNKLTGKNREVSFDVYYDYGIDDIGSCIDYLIKMERWTGGGNSKIDHKKDFPFENCQRPKMISLIEGKGLYKKLQLLVEETWNEFENSLLLNRKRKYD